MQPDDLLRENEALRGRLAKLSEASLCINGSPDFDTVLQGVLDSPRALTEARYGVVTHLDHSGGIQDFLASGMSAEQAEQLWRLPEGAGLFEYLSKLQEPLRLRDFLSHMRSLGLPEFHPPMPVGSVIPFLAAPVRARGEDVGNFFLGEKEDGQEFTSEDEETLVMFASQTAMVILNARQYRDEQKARADLETLIDTSPMGVAVFDARTGVPLSFNLEARRIVDGLRMPDMPSEQLLEVLTIRRADGREVSLEELSMAQTLSAGETVRAADLSQRLHHDPPGTALCAERRRDEAVLPDYRHPDRPDARADKRLA